MTNTYLLPEGMQIAVNGVVLTLSQPVLAVGDDVPEPSDVILVNGTSTPLYAKPEVFTSPEHAKVWGVDFYLWKQCRDLALPYEYYHSLDVRLREDPRSMSPAERVEALRIPGWRLRAACRYHGEPYPLETPNDRPSIRPSVP